jgi:hypothetical protein
VTQPVQGAPIPADGTRARALELGKAAFCTRLKTGDGPVRMVTAW